MTRARARGTPGSAMAWRAYAALGDSLTAGRDDTGPGGSRIGWARRLAGLLAARTGTPCAVAVLAADGASVTDILRDQVPRLAGPGPAGDSGPDLVSVTAGMNDIRVPGFREADFAAGLGRLLDGLAATGATVLTCTLPDITPHLPLPAEHAAPARQRMRQASDVIREQSARCGAVCLDLWARPGADDPALFGPDRIHPNAAGHQLLATAFADLLMASRW
jgi:lysophospholipase L1-like esterase